MDWKNAEEAMNALATKQVSHMLQRPDQLEKLDHHKKRMVQKKASMEALLKTVVQSQIESVRTGLQNLQFALNDVRDIKPKLQTLHSSLSPVSSYVHSFQDVRQEYFRHSQYAAAMDNMKQLFAVPESVAKTQAWINDGQLLHAHQSLLDLEQARDALLFELHRTPVKAHNTQAELNANQMALMNYFVDVEKLGADLAKQLWLVMKRALNAVRKEPHGVVTALRIIEREEQADAFALERQAATGFMPPGRPKLWKAKCLAVLEESVTERIEGNQFEERSDSKLWLVRHLEMTRQIILEDLRVVRTLCVPVFPPHWNPTLLFMGMYETVLKSHLNDLSANGLESNEYTTLLAWARHVYPGKELMGHPDLGLNKSLIRNLLDADVEEQLAINYLKDMGTNYNEWLTKTLAAEAQDWREDAEPVQDPEGYFHTEAPIIVFQMVEQNLQVAATVGKDLVQRVLLKSFEEIIAHGGAYKSAVHDYKLRYFEDRSQIPYFTQYIIAILNNCDRYIELGSSLKERYDGAEDGNVLHKKLEKVFQNIREDAVSFLLEEAFLDLEPHFTDVCTRKWLASSASVDTIFATLSDYFQDYVHLCPTNLRRVLEKAQDLFMKKYLGAFFQRKLNLKTLEERKVFSDRLSSEAKRLEDFVQAQFEGFRNQRMDETLTAMTALTEVVKIEDVEFLTLELHGFIKNFPDITQPHLMSLLSLRGDLGRLEMRQLIGEVLPDNQVEISETRTIFSSIQVPTSLF